MKTIYLDNNATTRVDPAVVEAMLPIFMEVYGNASSSSHAYGWAAIDCVDTARKQVADLIGADEREIIFTSGATESCNLALKGVFALYHGTPAHLITQCTEHPTVLETARRLETQGVAVTYLPVDAVGRVRLSDISDAIRPETVVVSIMAANNEIGSINDLAAIGALCQERGVLFHTDATQALGKLSIDVEQMGIHMLSCSAHKMHGPKGVGALYARRRRPTVKLVAQIDGGEQERGRRSGTLNVPGIVGFGAAAAICRNNLNSESAELSTLRDRLIEGLLTAIDGAQLVGPRDRRLVNNASIYIPGVNSEALMASLHDIAISSGSACSSAAVKPSHVLTALGGPSDLAQSTIRLGVSRFTTDLEVETAIQRIPAEAARLRQLTSSVDQVSSKH